MRIGIDISQLAYPQTGVANYLGSLLKELISKDKKNQYVLFFSSLRGKLQPEYLDIFSKSDNVHVKSFKIPPSMLDLLWNKLHKVPIEKFLGDIDFYISSDWTEPPVRSAKKATILYDLIVYKYPEETAQKIIEVQKRKLKWVKKESDLVFCISDSTKKDARDILGITADKLKVIYPGL